MTCFEYGCNRTMFPIDPAVSCMNDALAAGSTAMAKWDHMDSAGYTVDRLVFADEHRVRSFTVDDSAHSVIEDPSCAGPFRVADQPLCGQPVLAWACP